MSPRKIRLLEGKALRDAAKLNLMTDVALIKADAEAQGPGARITEAVADYLQILGEGAIDLAKENKGQLASGLGLAAAGVAAWLYRDTILEVIGGFLEGQQGGEEEADPEQASS